MHKEKKEKSTLLETGDTGESVVHLRTFSLHGVKLAREAASADCVAAENYQSQLKKLFEENGFRTQQVFNADEMGLFWKKMPCQRETETER